MDTRIKSTVKVSIPIGTLDHDNKEPHKGKILVFCKLTWFPAICMNNNNRSEILFLGVFYNLH